MTAKPIHWSARCETCREYLFSPDDCLAFRLRSPIGLEAVSLDGREPWSGIRVICPACLAFFARFAPPPFARFAPPTSCP